MTKKTFITLLIIFTAFTTNCIAQTVTIAGKTKGEITKKELLNSKELSMKDSSVHIVSFRMTLVSTTKGVEPLDIANTENCELNDLMLQAIKNAPPGSKLYFEYIKCADKTNTIQNLTPLSFVIK